MRRAGAGYTPAVMNSYGYQPLTSGELRQIETKHRIAARARTGEYPALDPVWWTPRVALFH